MHRAAHLSPCFLLASGSESDGALCPGKDGRLRLGKRGLPCAYVFMALFADVLDHVEWKSGFRCDGLAMSIYNIIAVAIIGICTGIFNGLLSGSGYVQPYLDEAGNLIAVQSETVKNVITFGFVGLETITGVVLAVLLLFLSVEKNIDREQAEIKARKESK